MASGNIAVSIRVQNGWNRLLLIPIGATVELRGHWATLLSVRGPVATVWLKGSAEVRECWLREIAEVRA